MTAVPPALWLGAVVAAATCATAGLAQAPTNTFAAGQAHYLESCGGCHGIDGVSSQQHIPALRGSAGQFLCSPAGREYIVRLPNVAFADVDDQALADVMNFVVFGLGGSSAPPKAKPYTRVEVAAWRREPLKNRPLAAMRATVLADASVHCKGRS